MKEQIKYDPEDIESLLLHKEYQDLYPEEREFVLKHLDNKEEYDSMRTMLLTISSLDDQDEIEPQSKTLDLLMEEFVTEEKQGFKWWLNSLFLGVFPQEKTWFRQPGFQIVIAMGIVVIGFIFVEQTNTTYENIAEAKTVSKKEVSKPNTSKSKNYEDEALDLDENSEIKTDKIKAKKPNDIAITEEENETVVSLENMTLESKDNSYTITRTITATDNCDIIYFNDDVDSDIFPIVDGLNITENRDDTKITSTIKEESGIEMPEPLTEDFALAEPIEDNESIEAEIKIIQESTSKGATNTFDLDNSAGNSMTPVILENMKTNTGNLSISASENLIACSNLIDLLYTAP